MADHTDDGFTALEHMDDKGRRALHVAGAMWERLYRDALDRAERAEWLFARIEKWSADWGLSFDVDKAAEAWDNRYRRHDVGTGLWRGALVERQAMRRQLATDRLADGPCSLHLPVNEEIAPIREVPPVVHRDSHVFVIVVGQPNKKPIYSPYRCRCASLPDTTTDGGRTRIPVAIDAPVAGTEDRHGARRQPPPRY